MESSIAVVAGRLQKKRRKIDPLWYLAVAVFCNFIIIGCLAYGIPMADTAIGKAIITASVTPCLIAAVCVWLGVGGLISEKRRR